MVIFLSSFIIFFWPDLNVQPEFDKIILLAAKKQWLKFSSWRIRAVLQNAKARRWRAFAPTCLMLVFQKTPAIAVSNLTLEHVLLHVGLAGRFWTSIEGMSVIVRIHPVIVLITVQG